ncbi:MAG: [NiFe]-hydrogenase assembly chaperone HybE, partial [Haemophilus parainfluenzae]|nr:[NiFe]-hydrogenase assembly chaperone HybE [Haemophilus parainfluenzae]
TFTVSSLENIPQYLSCSLHSPLDPNLTNEQAVQLTQDCLRMILSIPTAQPTFNADRRNLFKAMIK